MFWVILAIFVTFLTLLIVRQRRPIAGLSQRSVVMVCRVLPLCRHPVNHSPVLHVILEWK